MERGSGFRPSTPSAANRRCQRDAMGRLTPSRAAHALHRVALRRGEYHTRPFDVFLRAVAVSDDRLPLRPGRCHDQAWCPCHGADARASRSLWIVRMCQWTTDQGQRVNSAAAERVQHSRVEAGTWSSTDAGGAPLPDAVALQVQHKAAMLKEALIP